jgi:hypothetical protein
LRIAARRLCKQELIAEPKSAKKPFGWPFWNHIIAVIGIFAGPSATKTTKQKKTLSNRSRINLRQIGLAFYEYENEFGEYPNEEIAALITKKSPKPPTSATQNKESRTSSRLSFFQSDHHG